MESLGRKVKEDGVVIDEKILKVDGFLNHQIDATLMNEVGQTFYDAYKDAGITKILTIEASGIAPAIMAAFHLMFLVYSQKAKPSTLKDGFYSTEIHSFTKTRQAQLLSLKNFLERATKFLLLMTSLQMETHH